MFLISPSLPLVRYLEEKHAEILAEAQQLSAEDYADWPLEGAYHGGWKVFCLFSRDPHWLLAPSCASNSLRCPRTTAALARIPGAVRGGLSMLLPGAHIYLHADARTEDSLRCHLGLVTNPRAQIRFGERIVAWEAGRCLIFDGAEPHEAANLGDTPRVVCLVDVERPCLEEEVTA
jgi:aspartyl/asparaginyl beta-hydroxylase (cupin superfamily)